MSVVSNLGGGRHGYLMISMTAEDYMEYMGYEFAPPHNPGDYPPTMGNAQEQALRTEMLRQNQDLFRRCTAVKGAIKKHIVTSVQPVFLSPPKYQLMGFIQVTALQMMKHLFNSYGAIDKIDPE